MRDALSSFSRLCSAATAASRLAVCRSAFCTLSVLPHSGGAVLRRWDLATDLMARANVLATFIATRSATSVSYRLVRDHRGTVRAVSITTRQGVATGCVLFHAMGGASAMR